MGKIGILFMTKEVKGREKVAVRTIEAIKRHLACDSGIYNCLEWYIADGGSSPEYIANIKASLEGWANVNVFSSDESPGAVWNKALEQMWQDDIDIYLRLEDDFELLATMDITEWVRILREYKDIGMIRLGLMPIMLDLHSIGIDGNIYFEVKKSMPYSYSGNPGLVHIRFHEEYGMFSKNRNPGEIEIDLDSSVREKEFGYKIIWPMKIAGYGTYGAWAHIGEVQSYE